MPHPDGESTYRGRFFDPGWFLPILAGVLLVGAMLSQAYWVAWAFLGLLVLEIAWPWTIYILAMGEEGVRRLRQWLGRLKSYPSGLVGLVALAIGITLGIFFPDQLEFLGSGVKAVVRSIGSAAPFIIFFTLTPAIASTIRAGGAGKFALHVNLIYMATTVVAGLFAIAMVWPIFQMGLASPGSEGFGDALGEILGNLGGLVFSSAPFLAIWSAVGVSLMMFGFGFRGVEAFVAFVGGRMIELLGDVIKILMPLVLFALGVFIATGLDAPIEQAQSAGTIPPGTGLAGSLDPVQAYGLNVGILALLLGTWLFTASFIVMRYTKLPYKTFLFGYFFEVFPYAWASSSSAATIPINLERAGEGLKVRPQVREFIIPLGATINLDGTMMGGMLATVVAAQMVGYTPTVVDLLTILVPLTLVTVGVPGIPAGLALLGAPIISGLLPLDAEAVLIFEAIFIGFNLGLSDQFRTGVNSVDNGILARLFEYWYPLRYEKRRLGPEFIDGIYVARARKTKPRPRNVKTNASPAARTVNLTA